VIGYDERPDGNYYGFYTNASEAEPDIQWARFAPAAANVEWGVDALYTIAPEAVPMSITPLPFDLTLIA
jgi:hypothetical protein